MSDGSKVEDVVKDWGERLLRVFERSAGNPPVLGLELISLGAFVKMIPTLDFVIWDLAGNHVPPVNVQNAVKSAKAANVPVPSWAQSIMDFGNEIINLGTLQVASGL